MRGRELPEIVTIPDVGVEEGSFRESGSKGSCYLAGNINIFVDAALPSSAIADIEYDPEHERLTVTFVRLAVSSTSLKLIFT